MALRPDRRSRPTPELRDRWNRPNHSAALRRRTRPAAGRPAAADPTRRRSSGRNTCSPPTPRSGAWSPSSGWSRRSCGGRPAVGKTTIARLLAERTDLVFEPLSATFSGVADLRKVFAAAQQPTRRSARARCCSSTRSTASTAPSRTASCPTSRTARSSWSAPPPRTRASNSTARCSPARQVFVLKRLDDSRPGHADRPRRGAHRPPAAARRRRPPGPDRHGGRRRPLPAQHGRAAPGPARRRHHRWTPPGSPSTSSSGLRCTTRRRRATTT